MSGPMSFRVAQKKRSAKLKTQSLWLVAMRPIYPTGCEHVLQREGFEVRDLGHSIRRLSRKMWSSSTQAIEELASINKWAGKRA